MKRISQQSQMQQARKRVTFCYLCGDALPSSKAERRAEVSYEHVIPKQLFDGVDVADSDKWLVGLDVHSSCDRKNKQKFDNNYQRLHRLCVSDGQGPIQGPRKGGFPATPDVTDGQTPVFRNMNWLFDSVKLWLRGIHAALYSECLPISTSHLVIPPVPAFGGGPEGMPLVEVEKASLRIKEVLKRSHKLDRWDGVSAWGGHLQYCCVWWKRRAKNKEPVWECIWGLSFPGVLQWSAQTPSLTGPRPWLGQYIATTVPSIASKLTLDQFNSVAETV